MRRVKKQSELLPPCASVRSGSCKPPARDTDSRLTLLEEQMCFISKQMGEVILANEAFKMCLRGLADMGQIDYDEELFQAALNKCFDFVDRDTKQEFTNLSSEEMRELRYQEFRSENFEE